MKVASYTSPKKFCVKLVAASAACVKKKKAQFSVIRDGGTNPTPFKATRQKIFINRGSNLKRESRTLPPQSLQEVKGCRVQPAENPEDPAERCLLGTGTICFQGCNVIRMGKRFCKKNREMDIQNRTNRASKLGHEEKDIP